MPTVYHFSLTSGLSCWQHLSAAGHTRGTLDVSRVAEPLPGPLPGGEAIALRAAPALCASILAA